MTGEPKPAMEHGPTGVWDGDLADALEDALQVVQAFYERARMLGWRTPEMVDARELLRKWRPLEVWS